MALRIGVDAGSKTIKVVILDEDDTVLFSSYTRHKFSINSTLATILKECLWRKGDYEGTICVTGSAGIGLAEALGLPFEQEIVATTAAVRHTYPEAQSVIELGGEDAKVIYLDEPVEQRMNATCAGGTGGFIDTIAHMLGVRAAGIHDLALGASHIYPIASRCAVFAQTDVRPLLNAGVSRHDLAASALEAVVRQTISGLACGREIKPPVVLLGGPCEYIPDIVLRFRRSLGLDVNTGIKPLDAHLFTVTGAALLSDQRPDCVTISLSDLLARVESTPLADDLERLPKLFDYEEEISAFRKAHDIHCFETMELYDYHGPLFVGIDAGSTAVKVAVLTQDDKLVYQNYVKTSGDVLEAVSGVVRKLVESTESRRYTTKIDAFIGHTTVTGYGEDLLIAGLRADSGVVETVAHATAALHIDPQLSFLLDIGGQDMKAIWVKDGVIQDTVLNEACSSGCGAFIESTGRSLKMDKARFANEALGAETPVDLGTKCTVFMTSRVRHAQKVGATAGDLAAGLAYSVVKNALFRIIGINNVASLGDHIVVQGGAFKSDAVLRAFEKICGVQALRPYEAHLMGAIGAALVAKERYFAELAERDKIAQDNTDGGNNASDTKQVAETHPAEREPLMSTLLSSTEIDALKPKRKAAYCTGCSNNCLVTLINFGDGRYFASGNQCPIGEETLCNANKLEAVARKVERKAPNAVTVAQKLISSYSNVRQDGPLGQCIVGLPQTLNTYAQTPFWHTLFTQLGFSVAVYEGEQTQVNKRDHAGSETIPSESVCYPAKLNHLRVRALTQAGANAIFLPTYVRGNHCPVSSGYPQVVGSSMDELSDGRVAFCSPALQNREPSMIESGSEDYLTLQEAIGELARSYMNNITPEQFAQAWEAAMAELLKHYDVVAKANYEALTWAQQPGHHGMAIVGRTYQMDPAVLHSIDHTITGLGFAVMDATYVLHLVDPAAIQPLPKAYQLDTFTWQGDTRSLRIGNVIAQLDHVVPVFLESFGCGYESLTLPFTIELMQHYRKPFARIKIDDMIDTAHVRIRLRTLAQTLQQQEFYANRQVVEHASLRELLRIPELRDDEREFENLNLADVETARQMNRDMCYVVAALTGRAMRLARAQETTNEDTNPFPVLNYESNNESSDSGEHVANTLARTVLPAVPYACQKCMFDALPEFVKRACNAVEGVEWTNIYPLSMRFVQQTEQQATGSTASRTANQTSSSSPENISPASTESSALASAPITVASAAETSANNTVVRMAATSCIRPIVGIVGPASLCFNTGLNENLPALVEKLGWTLSYPDVANLMVDDMRYLTQLETYEHTGVHDILYLQAFGCLKGHTMARGALRELKKRFPNLRITVLDYDPESSALNRENRIRLALSKPLHF